MKKWKEVLQRIRTDKKLVLLVSAGIVGMLLLLVSGTRQTSKPAADDFFSLKCRTEEALENKTEKLLSTVAGVGKVRVVVTLESLEETVYAKNSEARGADDSSLFVVVKQGGSEYGLSEKVIMPAVRGVAVSCAGAGSAAVRQEVSGLVCAALGVSPNRVYISRMAE